MSEPAADLDHLDAVSAAIENGVGLPGVVRAAANALDASLAVSDASGSVLAVAARSPAEERDLLSKGKGVTSLPLRRAETLLGTIHMRVRSQPRPALLRITTTLIAAEVERVHAPGKAFESAAGDFLRALFAKEIDTREQLHEKATELAIDLREGASMLVVRAHPQAQPEEGWRERVRTVAQRGARVACRGAIAALAERDGVAAAEVLMLLPTGEEQVAARAADAVMTEMQAALPGCTLALGRSRIADDAADLPRAASEALLAANVADDGSGVSLAFEQTGAYRLLLSTMSENPLELRRFFAETVEPLIAYDEQYETDLLETLHTFLEADGNVARTAQRMFTHRHTIYYRLERIRDITSLDVNSTDGREKLSLGLKAMRVLGLSSPAGPASEAGTEGGRVPPTSASRRS